MLKTKKLLASREKNCDLLVSLTLHEISCHEKLSTCPVTPDAPNVREVLAVCWRNGAGVMEPGLCEMTI